MVYLFADLLLVNQVQFRGREIPEKDDRRFNQITVVWAPGSGPSVSELVHE